jgi:glutamate-1-semialdehyde 2,1-aminomutase
MPVSAVAGRKEVMALAGPGSEKTSQVKFEGGTFSAHPMSMLAGSVYLSHLIANAGKIYGRIGRLGNQVRRDLENIFRSRGFCVRCTGANEEITEGSSLVGLHFLHKDLPEISSPDEVWNSDISDFDMRERIFKLAMLKEGFNTFHGFGGISSAHRESQIQEALDAADRIAASWKTERLKY